MRPLLVIVFWGYTTEHIREHRHHKFVTLLPFGSRLMQIRERVLNTTWRLSCWASRQVEKDESQPSKSEQLRALLRKHPNWRFGHLELGEESLAVDDIATAYASAQIVLHLESPSPHSHYAARASFLLGRCYLRRGDAQRALKYFSDECSDPSLKWKIKEESAAAHMVCGDSCSALSTLLSIPIDKLSPEGAAAKEFLIKQQKGSLTSIDYSTPR